MRFRKLKGYKYELMEFTVCKNTIEKVSIDTTYVRLKNGELLVRKHYAWDGPSGPTFDTKSFMRGSLFHDVLYQLMYNGQLDKKYRKYADQLLRQICREDGMNRIRAWYVYRSVRAFGGFKVRKKPLVEKIYEI